MRNKLADAFGADPSLLKFRVTNPGRHQDKTQDYVRAASDLRAARAELRSALARARSESPAGNAGGLDAAAVAGIASGLECPVVYVAATVYGAAAIFVPPDGKLDSLLLETINSDITREMLHGARGKPGYAAGAMAGDAIALQATLPGILDLLRTGIMEPLSQKVTAMGYNKAVLIPLGSLGLLPLHAAIAGSTPAFAYVPSPARCRGR